MMIIISDFIISLSLCYLDSRSLSLAGGPRFWRNETVCWCTECGHDTISREMSYQAEPSRQVCSEKLMFTLETHPLYAKAEKVESLKMIASLT